MASDDDELTGAGKDPDSAPPAPSSDEDLAHDDAARVYAETLDADEEAAPGLEVDLDSEGTDDLDAADLREESDAIAVDLTAPQEEEELDADEGVGPDSEEDLDDDEATLLDAAAAQPERPRLPLRGLALVGIAGSLWAAVAVMRCDETEPPAAPPMAVTEDDAPEAPVPAVEVETPPTPVADKEVEAENAPLPPAADPHPDPAEWAGDAREPAKVTYTVRHGGSIKNVANLFKIFHHEIQSLNPGVALDRNLAPNTAVVVYARPDAGQSASVGLPSAGSLDGGVPMLEGPGRHLKAIPWKAWGTAHTVGLLDQVLRQWAKADHAQPVLVGNLSARKGGRLQPHSTHQSGRDVDLGYMQKLPTGEELNWREMSERNLDADETWALLKLLVQSGEVEVIYIDRGVQKLLYTHALSSDLLSKRALKKWMEYPRPSGRPLIQHVKGHVDHMHVRFKCQSAETRCKSRG